MVLGVPILKHITVILVVSTCYHINSEYWDTKDSNHNYPSKGQVCCTLQHSIQNRQMEWQRTEILIRASFTVCSGLSVSVFRI